MPHVSEVRRFTNLNRKGTLDFSEWNLHFHFQNTYVPKPLARPMFAADAVLAGLQ